MQFSWLSVNGCKIAHVYSMQVSLSWFFHGAHESSTSSVSPGDASLRHLYVQTTVQTYTPVDGSFVASEIRYDVWLIGPCKFGRKCIQLACKHFPLWHYEVTILGFSAILNRFLVKHFRMIN